MEYTIQELKDLMQLSLTTAHAAATKHIEDYGEQFYCGFAWVDIRGIKGSTKLGRAMKAAGYEKDDSSAFSIWNPSGLNTQCMRTLQAGARAAAQVFSDAGFKAHAGSRAD